MVDKKKFLSDFYVGFGSMIILGISGLIINILIASNFDASLLGVFNKLFAIYILGGQIGTMGLQYSI